MSTKGTYIALNIVGVLWVGGWGFLMFRYPKTFADWNARFRFWKFTSPKYISFIRKFGIAAMVIAGISAVSFLATLILGLKMY
jgi:hypothetical protein